MEEYSKEVKRELIDALRLYNSEERAYGLCTYIKYNTSYEAEVLFAKALVNHAELNGLSRSFPFNKGHFDYIREVERRSCRINPKRMAFVRGLIAALKEELAEGTSTDA